MSEEGSEELLLDNVYDECDNECASYCCNDVIDSSSCDSSFCCSSYYSDSIPEWEAEIDALNELHYVKITPVIDIDCTQKSDNFEGSINRKKKENTIKSEKFNKLIGKGKCKSSKKHFTRNKNQNASKVTFMDSQGGEEKEVVLKINAALRNLGRRSTLTENYLGLITSTFEDNKRIMIAGFVPSSSTNNQRNIKIGDWLKCINGTPVTVSNIDAVLSDLKPSTEVKLIIQRVAVCSADQESAAQDYYLDGCNEANVEDIMSINDTLNIPFGAIFFNIINTPHSHISTTDCDYVKYCFPEKDRNVLYNSVSDVLVKWFQLVPRVVSNEMYSTSILVKDELIHVVNFEEELYVVAIAVPNSLCSLFQLKQLCAMVFKYLKFCFDKAKCCTANEEKHKKLDRFFAKFFSRILTKYGNNFTEKVNQTDHLVYFNKFEDYFIYPSWLPLSSELQMKIDDVLNELESNDFGDLLIDNYGSQKSYVVVGSCLYHKGYLVLTHLSQDDQLDVHSYCHLEGLLNLTVNSVIQSLVIWHEVFLSSFKNSPTVVPSNKRWFILIVGQGESILVLLLETGGCAAVATEYPKPDELYVQQAQETLSLIHGSGLTEISITALTSNMNPQIKYLSTSTTKPLSYWKSTENLLNFVNSSSVGSSSLKKSPEVTSILKHRETMESTNTSASYSSANALLFGENLEGDSSDSVSRTASSMFSDEAGPVIGRRAQRMKQSAAVTNLCHQSDSDYSDADFVETSSMLSDLKISTPVLPNKITCGKDNILFYYLDIDTYKGILICPPNDYSKGTNTTNGNNVDNVTNIVVNFHRSIQKIHLILNNVMTKKKFSEASQSVGKYRIPIKEYGILFEYSVPNVKKQNPFTYWVIGRLFNKPPREVYVCYEDKIPQNMVEIAFMLAMNVQ